MKYLVIEALVPLRVAPSHRAELGSQLLFGELVTAQEVRGDWMLVTNLADGYVGWVVGSMLQPLPGRLEGAQWGYLAQPLATYVIVHHLKSHLGRLPMGARFPLMANENEQRLLSFTVGKFQYVIDYSLVQPVPARPSAANVLLAAEAMLFSPYLWGGKTQAGIDCSGLTQVCYALQGVQLPRDAKDQATVGQPVAELSQARVGDLVFFANDEGAVVHVGLLNTSHEVLHAAGSGHVRVDTLTQEGIKHREWQVLTHKLHSIRRVVS